MMLTWLPDASIGTVSRRLPTPCFGRLSSTCSRMHAALRPIRMLLLCAWNLRKTCLPADAWWRLTTHLQVQPLGQIACCSPAVNKFLRRILITDYWTIAGPPQGAAVGPCPPVVLRPCGLPPYPFGADGFPKNPRFSMAWAGPERTWNAIHRRQWRATSAAQTTHYWALPPPITVFRPPPITHPRGRLNPVQFGINPSNLIWHILADNALSEEEPPSTSEEEPPSTPE